MIMVLIFQDCLEGRSEVFTSLPLKKKIMVTILNYPFELSENIEIEMPDHAKILDVQQVNGQWNMWVLVDTSHPRVKRKFRGLWTGEELKGWDGFRTHIKTVQDVRVWHIFE
jgi:hypothetical protein